MIASIGGNTCPISAFSGFAESPGPSATLTHRRRDDWWMLWLSKWPVKLADLFLANYK